MANRILNQRIFKVSKDITVKCRSEKTSSGFRHLATLFVRGSERETAKATYQNRTWERYEFQSVLSRLLETTTSLTPKEREQFKYFIEQDHTDWSGMESVARIASLGEVFGTSKKEKNDWKARMLKAGLGNSGLEMPEDWDTLSEAEKERRLNQAIQQLREHR